MTISPLHSDRLYTLHRCPPLSARTRFGDDRVDFRAACNGPYDAYVPSNLESPIVPPWRVLPWPKRCDPVVAPAVQAARSMTDATPVGRTLDVFV